MLKHEKFFISVTKRHMTLNVFYAASGTRVLPSFFLNDDPWLTLTYFTARSNLVSYAFVLETIVVYDIKVRRCS